MTPNRRLDQLEPLMADSLQKIDRLIEGQGQLVELATNTKSELDQVKKTGELTAIGLANLTVTTQKQLEILQAGQEELRLEQKSLNENYDGLRLGQERIEANYDELRLGQERLEANYDGLRLGQERIEANYDELRIGQEILKRGQGQLTKAYEELRVSQEKLVAGQELILQILREKLS
ncbi:hypothetical protein [Spirosoma aerolatum]|uniref:hypothetical protein n=1 Tax=Spirosoma aerolatum TaxID=1211326 RepID=UPI0015D0ADFB|nr:hypothetical protein [Spirosoma aerolatum]